MRWGDSWSEETRTLQPKRAHGLLSLFRTPGPFPPGFRLSSSVVIAIALTVLVPALLCYRLLIPMEFHTPYVHLCSTLPSPIGSSERFRSGTGNSRIGSDCNRRNLRVAASSALPSHERLVLRHRTLTSSQQPQRRWRKQLLPTFSHPSSYGIDVPFAMDVAHSKRGEGANARSTVAAASSSPSSPEEQRSSNIVPKRHLLSACVDASDRAATAIREVLRRVESGEQDLGIVDKYSPKEEDNSSSSNSESGLMRGINDSPNPGAKIQDPQTLADRVAQTVIITSLKKTFPGLSIVGEEGELEAATGGGMEEAAWAMPQRGVLRLDLCDEGMEEKGGIAGGEGFEPPSSSSSSSSSSSLIDLSRVVVYVDPLDGTKEFTSRRLHAVSVLIGIAFEGRAIGGVIRFPFSDNDDGKNSRIYGALGLGVFGLETKEGGRSHWREGEDFSAIVSNTRAQGPVQWALDLVKPSSIVNAGGAGYKILKLLDGTADAYVFPRPGMYLWDTCAGEALLRAMGGDLTDRFGNHIRYSPEPSAHSVSNGLIAATSEALHKHLVPKVAVMDALMKLPPPLVDGDEAAAEDGVIDEEWLESRLCLAPNSISGFRVKPGTYRGRHCSLVKLSLDLNGDDEDDAGHSDSKTPPQPLPPAAGSNPPNNIVLKRVVMRELPTRNLEKMRRDIRSYRAEAGFIRDVVPLLVEEGVHVPRPLHVLSESPESLADATEDELLSSRFLMISEELIGYQQHLFLGPEEVRTALSLLARLHGRTYRSEDVLKAASQSAWTFGSYWSLEKRSGEEIANTQKCWERFLAEFASTDDVFFGQEDIQKLGARLAQAAAPTHAELLRRREEDGHRSIIHGDFKTANVFFRKKGEEASANTPHPAVERGASSSSSSAAAASSAAMIDFQWSGVGVPEMDVAYLLLSSAALPVLNDLETFLRGYYEEFVANAAGNEDAESDASPPLPSYDQFLKDFKLAVVDYARVVVGYQWQGAKAEWMSTRKDELGACTHNRSLPHVKWFIRYVTNVLSELNA